MTLYYTRKQITLPDKIIGEGKIFGDRDVPAEMITDMLATNIIIAVKDRDIPLEYKAPEQKDEDSEEDEAEGEGDGDEGEADEGDEEPSEQNGTKKPTNEVKPRAKKRRRR